jgi:hypothetical protein
LRHFVSFLLFSSSNRKSTRPSSYSSCCSVVVVVVVVVTDHSTNTNDNHPACAGVDLTKSDFAARRSAAPLLYHTNSDNHRAHTKSASDQSEHSELRRQNAHSKSDSAAASSAASASDLHRVPFSRGHICSDNVDTISNSTICQTLLALADGVTNNETAAVCQGIQYRAVTGKCCPIPRNFCNLCEQGVLLRLPEPDMRVSGVTCAQVGGLASFAPGDASCEAYQSTYGVYCGCNNPIVSENACRICGANVPITYRNLVLAPDFATTADAPARRFCGELEFFAQFMTTPTLPTCADFQAEYGDVCCVVAG